MTLNHSSMFRRELIEAIGLGTGCASRPMPSSWRGSSVIPAQDFAPLGGSTALFALDSHESLTRQGHTHVFTMFHGVRRVYHDASSHWRESTTIGHPIMPGAGGERPFPAPNAILPTRPATPELDILFIFDFAMAGGAYVSTRNYVEAAVKVGGVSASSTTRDSI